VNGAESLLAAITRNGIDVCFANPGTSELHFVAALDHAAGIRLGTDLAGCGVPRRGRRGRAHRPHRPGQTASLILPADVSWTTLTPEPSAAVVTVSPPPPVSAAAIDAAARSPNERDHAAGRRRGCRNRLSNQINRGRGWKPSGRPAAQALCRPALLRAG
jgi:hypothetical protein